MTSHVTFIVIFILVLTSISFINIEVKRFAQIQIVDFTTPALFGTGQNFTHVYLIQIHQYGLTLGSNWVMVMLGKYLLP